MSFLKRTGWLTLLILFSSRSGAAEAVFAAPEGMKSWTRVACEISLAPQKDYAPGAADLDAGSEASTIKAYQLSHEAWVNGLNFTPGLKAKLKTNPFLFPLVLAAANQKEIGDEGYKTLRQMFYQQTGDDGAPLAAAEAAELDNWLKANTEGEKALQALYAKKSFKQVLTFEDQLTFGGISVDGLADSVRARGSRWKQLLALPKTLRTLKRIIDERFKPSTLDENLYAFHGFHQNTGDRFYGQRPWERVNLNAINGSSIQDISDEEFVGIMIFAMEVEDPILDYSWQTGEGLRFLLPTMGRFMGKNKEQAELIRRLKQAGDEKAKWCESPWCEEERRHGNIWSKLTSIITGVEPSRDNPEDAYEHSPTEEGAQFLHYSRQSTEWGATSSYLLLAAHAEGDLRQAALNVASDEIKHLTILTAAQAYLFGYSRWTRLKTMIQKNIAEYRSHKKNRTTGGQVSSNPVTFIEMLASLVMVEAKMSRYMKTLPIGALREFFEFQSRLPEIAAAEIPAELRQHMEDLKDAGTVVRQGYLRWTPKALAETIKQVGFEKMNEKLINSLIEKEFQGFSGAEDFESSSSRQHQDRIKTIDLSSHKFLGWTPNGPTEDNLRKALYHRLRTYQILNNAHVRELREKEAQAEKAALKPDEAGPRR